jgi:tetratricopeptide (TPR) repeat protein
MDSDFTTHMALATIYGRLGRYDESVRERQRMMSLLGYGDISNGLAAGYARGDYQGALREFTARLVLLRRQGESFVRVPSWFIASVYADLRDKDRAFEWLDKAYVERDDHLPQLNSDPMWDSVRSDSRFAELVRRVGLPSS